jgi:competence protein ComEA
MKTVRNIMSISLVVGMLIAASSAAYAEEEATPSKIVNINTAGSAELESLPGIGPSKAAAIIDYRTKHPFAKVDDITKVKGIGKKTFLKLKPYLAVSGDAGAGKPSQPKKE